MHKYFTHTDAVNTTIPVFFKDIHIKRSGYALRLQFQVLGLGLGVERKDENRVWECTRSASFEAFHFGQENRK